MNYKMTGLKLAAAIAALSMSLGAHAQSTASANGSASATITQPISVTKNLDMAFGTLVKPASGSGSATISNAGARTVAGGVEALGSTAASAARFTVSGEGGQSISVTVPPTITLNNTAPNTGSLTVTTTNDMTGSASSQTLSGSIGSAGSLVVNVGGSMTIASTQNTGVYTGTFTVSASYN